MTQFYYIRIKNAKRILLEIKDLVNFPFFVNFMKGNDVDVKGKGYRLLI